MNENNDDDDLEGKLSEKEEVASIQVQSCLNNGAVFAKGVTRDYGWLGITRYYECSLQYKHDYSPEMMEKLCPAYRNNNYECIAPKNLK